MHRTKSAEVMNSRWAQGLGADIGDRKYNLLLGESTDGRVTKKLKVITPSFSGDKGHVVTARLGPLELEEWLLDQYSDDNTQISGDTSAQRE